MVYIYDDLSDGTKFDATFLQPLTDAVGRIPNVGFRSAQGANYLIFKVDSTYYRRNGLTGEIDDSGTNGASLIQNTINTLPTSGAEGGTIVLIGALSIGSTSLEIDDYITLKGLGVDATTLTYTGSDYAIKFKDKTTKNTYHAKLEDMTITGSASGLGALEIYNGIYCQVNHVFSNGWGTANANNAVILLNGSVGKGSYWNEFRAVQIYNAYMGIKFTGANPPKSNQNSWFGGRIDTVNTGVFVDKGYHNAFYNLDISNGTTGWDVDDNRTYISNPYLESLTNGFILDGSFTLIDSVYAGSVTTLLTDNGTRNRIRGEGFENNGYSTGTGGQQTIAHGCLFTPTESQVILSERTTGGALAKQSAAPDATNIYVTATAAKDYNWNVKY